MMYAEQTKFFRP